MLVLTRKRHEKIRIGDDVTITILRINANHVRVGIEAPPQVRVTRGELKRFEIDIVEPSNESTSAIDLVCCHAMGL